jgi:uncharacterized RDD family membrane protein YckC
MDPQQPEQRPEPPRDQVPAVPWQAPAEEAGPAPGIRYASHGGRLLAYIIDVVILGAVLTALFMVLALSARGDMQPDGEFGAGGAGAFLLFMLLAIVISIAYFPFFWARSGATPGMRMFRLRVVRDRDGGPISGGQAIMRLIGYWINQIALYIGFAWILVDQRRRGWHDLIAGTVVIEEPPR